MNARRNLPYRRPCVTRSYVCNGLNYTVSFGQFPDGSLAEVFITNSKAGSQSDAAAKDSAVVCPIALQHGVPLETIRRAFMRDPRGLASSPLGCALDLIAAAEAP